jgi:hypothetical protein
MTNQSMRWISRIIFVLGILSVLTTTAVSLTDWFFAQRYLGFMAYFSGVPVAFLSYSGFSTSADSNAKIALVSATIIAFSVGFAVWSDKILAACSVQRARLFIFALVVLCCFNLAVSYFGALFRLPDMFGGQRSSSFGGDSSYAAYVVGASQLIATILYYSVWQYWGLHRLSRLGKR